jgi:hypothetical protein
MSKLRVTVVFEFDEVDNDADADAIAESINESCETMQTGFNASACWVHNVSITDEA